MVIKQINFISSIRANCLIHFNNYFIVFNNCYFFCKREVRCRHKQTHLVIITYYLYYIFRRELCLAVGIKASATVFTSIISQKNAKQAGFQEFVEIDYDDLEKINPIWNFPGITTFTKSIKNMYIQFS